MGKNEAESGIAASETPRENEPLGEPCVGLAPDLPRDVGLLWRTYPTDLSREQTERFHEVARQMGLPWERGARAYYVDRSRLADFQRRMEQVGIEVAYTPDALHALQGE